MRFPRFRSALITTLAAFVLFAAVGCAHVKREEMVTELDQVREQMRAEMNEGDAALGADIDRLEQSIGEIEREVAENRARIEALDRDLEALRSEFGATVERMEGMIAFNLPVHFGFDSDVIRDQDKKVLDRFAHVVREYYDGSLITVEGFADPAGDPEYNLRLGKRRAEGVKSYLSEIAELNGEKIRTVSYGESQDRLVKPGAWGEDGVENRRVTLVIDYRATGEF